MSAHELEELREWARVGRRSMQREIIWRLFTIEGNQAPKYAPSVSEPRVEVREIKASEKPWPVTDPFKADQHFKPDFKKERK